MNPPHTSVNSCDRVTFPQEISQSEAKEAPAFRKGRVHGGPKFHKEGKILCASRSKCFAFGNI